MEHQGQEMDPATEKRYHQFYNWVKGQYGDAIDKQDVDAAFDSTLTVGEMSHEYAKQHPIAKEEPKHQYQSRNYAADQERRQEEAMEIAKDEERLRKAVPGTRTQEEIIEGGEPSPPPGAKKPPWEPVAERVAGYVEAGKKRLGIDEKSQEHALKKREYEAARRIEGRTSRLAVSALEAKEKELERREFDESPVGRIIKGAKDYSDEQREEHYRDKYYRDRYGRRYARAPHEAYSPMRSALSGKETPMWIKYGSGAPGIMGQVASPQRSMIMDVAMGRYGSGYRGGVGYQGSGPYPQRQPRRKVIVVNGRTYVVQHEPKAGYAGYQGAPPPEPPSMLMGMMQGSPSYAHHPGAAALAPGDSHQSPMMQAMMGGHGSLPGVGTSPHPSHRGESRSAISNAMGSGVGSGKLFGAAISGKSKFKIV